MKLEQEDVQCYFSFAYNLETKGKRKLVCKYKNLHIGSTKITNWHIIFGKTGINSVKTTIQDKLTFRHYKTNSLMGAQISETTFTTYTMWALGVKMTRVVFRNQ